MVKNELEALYSCYNLLSKLESQEQLRIIRWLISKLDLQINTKQTAQTNPPLALLNESGTTYPQSSVGDAFPNIETTPTPTIDKTEASIAQTNKSINLNSFKTLEQVFAQATPKTDSEKVLLAAAFLQTKQRWKEFGAFVVQKELKRIGKKSANITTSIKMLSTKKPALIVELQKTGDSKQSRKTYKVTPEGLEAALRLITV